jgi:hypothetical protein
MIIAFLKGKFSCFLAFQVLGRGAPSYMGQIAALFHPKDRGWRVLGHSLPHTKFK